MAENGVKVLFHRPAGLGHVQLLTDLWAWSLSIEMFKSPEVYQCKVSGWESPWMAMGRNVAAKTAIDEGFDYLLMVDPDMLPDMYVGQVAVARRFWSSSLAALKQHPGGIVAAPYVGPRPDMKPHIWRAREDESITRVTHGECQESMLSPTFERVPGAGTGVMLIDVKAFDKLEPPYFFDIYETQEHVKMQMSFDVNFCRLANEAEIPVWCNWYSWAGHIRHECLGCPGLDHENILTAGRDESVKFSVET